MSGGSASGIQIAGNAGQERFKTCKQAQMMSGGRETKPAQAAGGRSVGNRGGWWTEPCYQGGWTLTLAERGAQAAGGRVNAGCNKTTTGSTKERTAATKAQGGVEPGCCGGGWAAEEVVVVEGREECGLAIGVRNEEWKWC